MKRNESLTAVFTQFDKSANEFCEKTNGHFCEISSVYNGEEEPKNLQYRVAQIYYNSFVIEFVYTAHGALDTLNSIVSCNVYLDKKEDAVGIPLPLLTDYCGKNIATPMCIPFISNTTGMVQAFSCFSNVFAEFITDIQTVSCDEAEKTRILTACAEEMTYPNEYYALRFSTIPFINYIRGYGELATEQLKKSGPLTGYEKRLLQIWSEANQAELPDLSAIIKNMELYTETGMPKTNFKEFGAVFVSWLVLLPLTTAVFLAVYFLAVWLEGRESIYLMGPMYNFPCTILLGFVTAIAASYFTRFHFYKWMFKKDYERYCELDYMQNGGGADRLMKGFFRVVFVLGIIFCILMAKWNFNFLPDGFVDNSKFFSLKGEYYAYTQIDKIYYNEEQPSYVILLKNGEEVDLYDLGDVEDYEGSLLETLRQKGVKIEKE